MSASLASLKRPSRRKPLAACVAAVFALSAPAVYANTFFVSNCADSGIGSLPAAAAGAGNGDTISISISDNSLCTHNLQGVTEVKVLASNLTLATGVTISGPGRNTFGISGKQNYSVRASANLTVNDITVMYGKYLNSAANGNARGGCIYSGNNLTLSGVRTYHCYVHESGSGSTQAAGGAVAANFGFVDMTDTIIQNSKATGASAKGGAVYAWSGGVSMTNSYVTATGSSSGPKYGSQAVSTGGASGYSAQGGAVWSDGATTMTHSGIFHGTAYVGSNSGGKAVGGGIWSSGNVSLTGSSAVTYSYATTESNANALGGGIYSQAEVYIGNAHIGSTAATNSTVARSKAYSKSGQAHGGGTYSGGHTYLKYGYIHANQAVAPASTISSVGGGSYSKGGMTTKYGYFYRNSAAIGGAAKVFGGDVSIRGSTVLDNYSSNKYVLDLVPGGGSSTVTIEQSTISQNSTGTAGTGTGAGLFVQAQTTKLYNNTITYNHSGGTGAPLAFKYSSSSGTSVGLYSNLISSNSYGASNTKNDFTTITTGPGPGGPVTVSGNHNLIRTPGTGVPGDTIVNKCPMLYPGFYKYINLQYQWIVRHEVKSPATNAGANPLNFTSDQRGGYSGATSPPRVSGPPGGTAVADIGAYEIDQSDEIFDNRFESCTI